MPELSIHHDPLSAPPPSGVSRPQTGQPATSTASPLGAIQSGLQSPTLQFDQRDFLSDTAFFALDSAAAHPFRDWGIND